MAKRKTPKTVDLKIEKITEQELKEVQDLLRKINMAQADVGMIEVRKHEALHVILSMTQTFETVIQGLRKSYKAVDINVMDGSIKYNDDNNEADKKNNDR